MEVIKQEYIDKEAIQKRQMYLHQSLVLDELSTIKPGQRICVNQEIAALFRCLESYTDASEPVTPRYQIPAHLETKLKKLNKLIK